MKNTRFIMALALTVFSLGILVSTGISQAAEFEIDIKATLEGGNEEEITVSGKQNGENHEAATEETTAITETEDAASEEADTSGSLSERREQIAERQADMRRYAAAEEEKAPQALAAMLPVTGSLNMALAILISTALGIILPFTVRLACEKIRKSRRS